MSEQRLSFEVSSTYYKIYQIFERAQFRRTFFKTIYYMQHALLDIGHLTESLLQDEQVQFKCFCDLAYKARKIREATAPDPFELASQVGINLSSLNKISSLGPHVWVAFLSIYAEVETLAKI
jgi:hypothetical protein